jgi:hypothetical protein
MTEERFPAPSHASFSIVAISGSGSARDYCHQRAAL